MRALAAAAALAASLAAPGAAAGLTDHQRLTREIYWLVRALASGN